LISRGGAAAEEQGTKSTQVKLLLSKTFASFVRFVVNTDFIDEAQR